MKDILVMASIVFIIVISGCTQNQKDGIYHIDEYSDCNSYDREDLRVECRALKERSFDVCNEINSIQNVDYDTNHSFNNCISTVSRLYVGTPSMVVKCDLFKTGEFEEVERLRKWCRATILADKNECLDLTENSDESRDFAAMTTCLQILSELTRDSSICSYFNSAEFRSTCEKYYYPSNCDDIVSRESNECNTKVS